MQKPTKTTKKRSQKYAVPALEKGLDVLEHLSAQAIPMTQAQIARDLGRQPGEIFRMLNYLESRGYLRRDADTGGYVLSLKLFELARSHSPYEKLLKSARNAMRRLSDEIGESCHLSVLHHEHVLVLAQEESPKPFRLSVEVGSLHDPRRTTSGRLLLSQLNDDALEDILLMLPGWRARKRVEKAAFLERLAMIRDRGFECEEGERFVGGIDVGVPIGPPGGHIVAALTVAALKNDDGPDVDALRESLASCGAAIAIASGLATEDDLV